MKKLVKALKDDQELQELRIKWKEKTDTPFPPFNWDEYDGIPDYKRKISEKLKRMN